MHKHIQHNNDETTQFFRKIHLSLYGKGSKGLRRVLLCERWVGEWTELQHIDPHSYGHNSISFPFYWAAQPGAWGPSLCWNMVLIQAYSLQLIWTPTVWLPVSPRVISLFYAHSIQSVDSQGHPLISWYLRPDAPVIYTGAFLLLTAWPSRRSICNTWWLFLNVPELIFSYRCCIIWWCLSRL